MHGKQLISKHARHARDVLTMSEHAHRWPVEQEEVPRDRRPVELEERLPVEQEEVPRERRPVELTFTAGATVPVV